MRPTIRNQFLSSGDPSIPPEVCLTSQQQPNYPYRASRATILPRAQQIHNEYCQNPLVKFCDLQTVSHMASRFPAIDNDLGLKVLSPMPHPNEQHYKTIVQTKD